MCGAAIEYSIESTIQEELSLSDAMRSDRWCGFYTHAGREFLCRSVAHLRLTEQCRTFLRPFYHTEMRAKCDVSADGSDIVSPYLPLAARMCRCAPFSVSYMH
jgi:hypothetical protein